MLGVIFKSIKSILLKLPQYITEKEAILEVPKIFWNSKDVLASGKIVGFLPNSVSG